MCPVLSIQSRHFLIESTVLSYCIPTANLCNDKGKYFLYIYISLRLCYNDSRRSLHMSLTLSVSEFQCHIAGCKQLFDTLEGYEHHYNTLHRHVCSSCKRCFPSNRLLDIHILEWHDSLFQVMAERECMVMSTPEMIMMKYTQYICI